MADLWDELYGVQDWALAVLRTVEQGFYLTGGTALSRGYYHHRYSEDLDLFLSDRDEFELWRDRCLDALLRECRSRPGCTLDVLRRDERFGRAVIRAEVLLKIEFVNDVPSRVGEPVVHPVLGLLDTKENILANKVTALVDREEPKDVADIYWMCCRDTLDLWAALEGAEGKAAGIFPPLIAKRLAHAAERGVPDVRWVAPPDAEEFAAGIERLVDSLICF